VVEDEQIAEGVKEVVEAGKFVRPSLVKVDKLKGSLHFNNYVYKSLQSYSCSCTDRVRMNLMISPISFKHSYDLIGFEVPLT